MFSSRNYNRMRDATAIVMEKGKRAPAFEADVMRARREYNFEIGAEC